ncbi:glycogen/starch/alpha-glucan phosphorylase [Desulfopila sp. IMCC35006]|uniref:glycogen/starch/alpha-glucan phosphorylase n=1 Tax=Desulfopila sp. IMCC35006 TaxID=2569542 RepID=UPI0010AB4F74|nr:glycogen/starch/alpha-glucan phosphorylase [Desulfopila sp. IMCC35006]TKB23259.1 glycogen/starch/alpha-glucan phosphorylase [Desulfopila sp. IMCC35006]
MAEEHASGVNNQATDRSTIEKLKRGFAYKLFYQQGVWTQNASLNDYYLAVSTTVRDRMQQLFINSIRALQEKDSKIVSYLSAEFLVGPHLLNNLINLGMYDQIAQAAEESGLDLQQIIDHEEEPGLGNGGLGRLAACYLDSLSSLEIPAIGYGIRYEFGMFDQDLDNGWQKELSDRWLQPGNPWEFKKTDMAVEVGSGGHTERYLDDHGNSRVRWVQGRLVKGIPYDTPIPGYRVNTVNLLRLWSAEAPKSFDFAEFNTGDYFGAVHEKVLAENITKVLYPNDEQFKGKVLRLRQQYFFVSCSMQDMIRIHLFQYESLDNFSDNFAVQLNDTHPAIAVPEFMRLLVDVHHYEWDRAWEIVTSTFAYTNHTLLPEALEKWPVAMLGRLLPRHLEIIYEINSRFLDLVRLEYPGDEDVVRRMSIIDETGERSIRMANLACVGSHAINGVAELHTKLLKEHTLADFHRLWPAKLINITNGVTPRRWMVVSNPRLTKLISSAIGEEWITDLNKLRALEPLADDPAFCERWQEVKFENKQDICTMFTCDQAVRFNPHAMFDVQVKRIHEYKRQHLNLLHIVTLYHRLKNSPGLALPPRFFIFGGKAAPGYAMAKLIIKLINSVAEVINGDPDVNDRLQVLFIPNFNVQIGHIVYPMADLSEQISLAGKEASGTGNMKFSMNGALTIGTLDGANVEIREEVGPENFFLFGMNVQEVEAQKAAGYNPQVIYNQNEELKAAINLIATGHFSHGDRELFRPLIDSLLYEDPYMVLADYQAYIDCQQQVGEVYQEPGRWSRMAILNASRMGKFSSDRSITEYCEKIWHVKPFPVTLKLQRLPDNGIKFPKRNRIVRT